MDEDRRKELLPLIQSGLSGDDELKLGCIQLAGSYGGLSKELLPKLKQLKLSDSKAIREAAVAAVKKIED